jgi:hypothetical protein
MAPETVNSLLQSLTTRQGQTAPGKMAEDVIRVLKTISPPTAFYVRLLMNRELPEFNEVEQFFRTVVDPFIRDLDYTPVQMGRNARQQTIP